MIKCYILSITQACCKSKKEVMIAFESQINIDCLRRVQNIFILWRIETTNTKQYIFRIRAHLIFQEKIFTEVLAQSPKIISLNITTLPSFKKCSWKARGAQKMRPNAAALCFSYIHDIPKKRSLRQCTGFMCVYRAWDARKTFTKGRNTFWVSVSGARDFWTWNVPDYAVKY